MDAKQMFSAYLVYEDGKVQNKNTGKFLKHTHCFTDAERQADSSTALINMYRSYWRTREGNEMLTV